MCGRAQTVINFCKNSSLYSAYCSPQTHIIAWHEHQYWCKPSILNFTCLDHRKSLKLGIKVNVWKWNPFIGSMFCPQTRSVQLNFLQTKAMQFAVQCCTWGKHRFLTLPSFPISLVDFFFKLMTEYLVSTSDLSSVCPLVTQLFYRAQTDQWVAPR